MEKEESKGYEETTEEPKKQSWGGGDPFVEIVLKGLLSEGKIRGEIIHPSPILEKQKRSENGGR